MRHTLNAFFIVSLLCYLCPMLSAQDDMQAWVDSTYTRMSDDERIGQLIMIRAHSNLGSEHVQQVIKHIQEDHVGSACFFQGTAEEQVRLINQYQRLSKIPLLIAMDAEWGLGMRLKDDVLHYPYQMALGAVQDPAILRLMGEEVGRQLRRTGVHLNFAPVVDVNNNAANPVINYRSFGETPSLVSGRAIAYMKGMQSQGILTCAKHFPGHGDTDVDSHYDLPVIGHDARRLHDVELRPFRELISAGVDGVMVAHLQVPAIDDRPNTPTTLSTRAIEDLLLDSMHFEGLVISDAMEMQGVTKHYPAGEAEVRAVLAGNDVLCLPADVPKAIAAIREAVTSGRISPVRLRRSVTKVLMAKARLGLISHRPIPVENVDTDLHDAHAVSVQRQVTQATITTLRNVDRLIPLTDLDTTIALLQVGKEVDPTLSEMMEDHISCKTYRIRSAADLKSIATNLTKHTTVVAAFHGGSQRPSKQYGLEPDLIDQVAQLQGSHRVIALLLANAYAARYFDRYDHLILGYDSRPSVSVAMVDALLGVSATTGRLPVTASAAFVQDEGEDTQPAFRLGVAAPEEVGMSSELLGRVDSLMQEAIQDRATPGGQVLVIKDGKIVLERSYGYHTYKAEREVQTDDLYDVASLTKVLATTISIMHLFEQGTINIFRPVRDYLPETDTTALGAVTLEELLTHRSGFKPWIPFYRQTLTDKGRPDTKWYRRQPESQYSVQVADRLYIDRDYYTDSMWTQIVHAEMPHRGKYVYSDLGFYVLDEIINRTSGLTVDAYAMKYFYEPMGLTSIRYRPLATYDRPQIVPTEQDNYYRHQRLQGHVHDMGAAMKGGVSGHAGLFANARAVGAVMQMLLYGGYYGGRRYLDPYTVSLFTVRPDRETRRGLGFDMKQLDPTASENMAIEASHRTFGHLGFTGTAAWADPIHNLIYVFLSNRTYPSMENKKLLRDNYRPRIQQAIYRSVIGSVQ